MVLWLFSNTLVTERAWLWGSWHLEGAEPAALAWERVSWRNRPYAPAYNTMSDNTSENAAVTAPEVSLILQPCGLGVTWRGLVGSLLGSVCMFSSRQELDRIIRITTYSLCWQIWAAVVTREHVHCLRGSSGPMWTWLTYHSGVLCVQSCFSVSFAPFGFSRSFTLLRKGC